MPKTYWDRGRDKREEPSLIRLARPCKECTKRFTPSGKFHRVCDKCAKEIQSRKNKKNANA